MTQSCVAPSSMGFPRQYWSGLPFPSPGDLPDPGIKPVSLALADGSLPSESTGKPSIEKVQCWQRFAGLDRVTLEEENSRQRNKSSKCFIYLETNKKARMAAGKRAGKSQEKALKMDRFGAPSH